MLIAVCNLWRWFIALVLEIAQFSFEAAVATGHCSNSSLGSAPFQSFFESRSCCLLRGATTDLATVSFFGQWDVLDCQFKVLHLRVCLPNS